MFKGDQELNREIAAYLQSSGEAAAAHGHMIGSGAVWELERKIADHYEAKHAVCVASGTSGLMAIALALGLAGSDFITSPISFGGSLAGWLALGNRPVFVDTDPQTLTLDPVHITKSIAGNSKAILAIDALGNPSDTHALRDAADKFGLWYIADSAQGFGATRSGRPASHLADAIALSFTATKTLSCGEGGAVVTNDTELYEKLLWFSQHPLRQKRELGLGVCNEFAINTRIHPIAAIWANAIFEDSLKKLELRQEVHFRLIALLNSSGLTEPIEFEQASIRPSFFSFVVELKRGATARGIVDWLSSHGSKAGVSSLPASLIYKNPAFTSQYGNRFRVPKRCSISERAERRIALILDGDCEERIT